MILKCEKKKTFPRVDLNQIHADRRRFVIKLEHSRPPILGELKLAIEPEA